MHEMNEGIDTKIKDISEDMNDKIKNVATKIEKLTTTMDQRFETMGDSIFEEIRNLNRITEWEGTKIPVSKNKDIETWMKKERTKTII